LREKWTGLTDGLGDGLDVLNAVGDNIAELALATGDEHVRSGLSDGDWGALNERDITLLQSDIRSWDNGGADQSRAHGEGGENGELHVD
jgi:hypothetical protein